MCDSYSEAEDQEGVMDNLLEALKNGSAFIVNRERKDGRKRTPRAAGGELLVFDAPIIYCENVRLKLKS